MELEEYLRSASPSEVPSPSGRASLPREIRQAFFDLELPPGASQQEIREAYRKLLRMYHPDRFYNDPHRLRTASEVTHRVSLAYKRLNDYYRN
jgi:curved DNA-binding protein CbpA